MIRWIASRVSHFDAFENRTVEEVRIATELLKRRIQVTGSRKAISGNQLAKFLRNATDEEPLLLQRRKDLALRSINSSRSAEAPAPDPPPDEQGLEAIPSGPTRLEPEEMEVYDDF